MYCETWNETLCIHQTWDLLNTIKLFVFVKCISIYEYNIKIKVVKGREKRRDETAEEKTPKNHNGDTLYTTLLLGNIILA